MSKAPTLVVALLLAVPARAQGLALPLSRDAIHGLLQKFVSATFQKAFRHLGDEKDFDHGHLLFGPGKKPIAILYHTQEMALYQAKGSPYGYIDPEGRNWIQWLDKDTIENARKYARTEYPKTAQWRLFEKSELPGLNRHHTVTDKMLDPLLLGTEIEASKQWVFTRVECPKAQDESVIDVTLPSQEKVCLQLSGS
jgi:hypothetical protein